MDKSLTRPPDLEMNFVEFCQIPHYSDDPEHPVIFYGGLLSNFAHSPFHLISAMLPESIKPIWAADQRPESVYHFDTVEHFYQSMKAVRFEDFQRIAEAVSPGEAKAIGNRIEMRPDWDVQADSATGIGVKWEVMLHGLRCKFFGGSIRAAALLATGDRYIAEDSPTDTIWGITNHRRRRLDGLNLLGRALMQIRDELNGVVSDIE